MESKNVRIVLYYDHPATLVAGALTEKLRELFSAVLSIFQIVTGRLVKSPEGHWMVKCNDAGTRMVEARAKGSVVNWLKNVDREKELELVHWEDMFHKPYFWSPFYVKITEFEEGGLAIGLSCTHLLADPISATIILKAWADITLSGKITIPPLFHSLPSRRITKINPIPLLNSESNIVEHYKNSTNQHQPQHVKTVTLSFSHEMVTACMAMQRSSATEDQTLTPTPFEALAGLFWVAINNVKRILKSCDLKSLSICLDMRKALGLDKGFFGNCMVYNKVDFGKGGFDHNDLSKPAFAIREAVRNMDFEGIMDLVEYLERKENVSSCCNNHGLTCVNLEGAEAYDCVFEEEISKPVRVSYYVEPVVGEGQVVVLPPPHGGRSDFSRADGYTPRG